MKARPFFAELIGTFALVFIGAGTAAVGTGGLVGAALAIGLVYTVFIYLFGEISGGHFNPAVTFGVALSGNVEWVTAIFYWIAQCLGAILAAALLLFIFNGAGNGLGATVLASDVNPLQGVVVETVLTFFLVTAVLFGAIEGYAGKRAGFVIGLTLTFSILMGGPLTGGSLNPARTLGPAIFGGTLGEFWIYLVGTFVGAALAAVVYRFLKSKKK
jgi:MIP family channel proteins